MKDQIDELLPWFLRESCKVQGLGTKIKTAKSIEELRKLVVEALVIKLNIFSDLQNGAFVARGIEGKGPSNFGPTPPGIREELMQTYVTGGEKKRWDELEKWIGENQKKMVRFRGTMYRWPCDIVMAYWFTCCSRFG